MNHRRIAAAAFGLAGGLIIIGTAAGAVGAQDTHRPPGVERCVRVQIWPAPPPFAGVTPSILQSVCDYALPHKFNPPPPFPFLNDLR